MNELTWLNFYVPATNFVLFLVLFFVCFRSVFVRMAEQQRSEFLQGKNEAEREKKSAESQLRDLLYQEQELAKKNQAMMEQAEVDSQLRAQQIIDDAQFKSDQIRQEAERLMGADVLAAKKNLYYELQKHIEDTLDGKVQKMGAKSKNMFLATQLQDWTQLASGVSDDSMLGFEKRSEV